jgi:hypothetical protein
MTEAPERRARAARVECSIREVFPSREENPQGGWFYGGCGGTRAAAAVYTTRIHGEEEHTMTNDMWSGSSNNGHGAVDRDRLREEIAHLEASLRYGQARLCHTPGPSVPDMRRHQIQQTIDLLHQELALKRASEPS